MTMTDTEAKALALVNDTARAMEGLLTLHPVDHVYYRELPKMDVFANALCRVIEREAATEARHAAELREQAERFSEVATRMVAMAEEDCSPLWAGVTRQILAPFILPAPDPLVEAMADCGVDRFESWADQLRAAIEKRGGKIVWEAGE